MKIIPFLLNIYYSLNILYSRLFRPKSLGVRALVVVDNKILLVKHSYRSKYFIPGGGVKKGEHLEDAAAREVFEETGIKVNSESAKLVGVYRHFAEYKDDTIAIFIYNEVENYDEIKTDNFEIADVGWFDLAKLPDDINEGSKQRIEEYANNSINTHGKWEK